MLLVVALLPFTEHPSEGWARGSSDTSKWMNMTVDLAINGIRTETVEFARLIDKNWFILPGLQEKREMIVEQFLTANVWHTYQRIFQAISVLSSPPAPQVGTKEVFVKELDARSILKAQSLYHSTLNVTRALSIYTLLMNIVFIPVVITNYLYVLCLYILYSYSTFSRYSFFTPFTSSTKFIIHTFMSNLFH